MAEKRVLVVGTTADYIEIIGRRFPGRALFLTDRRERSSSTPYSPPKPEFEIPVDFADEEAVFKNLEIHLKKLTIRLSGIACFDCESMLLTAAVAERYSLPYPSIRAVAACRNKYLSRTLWQRDSIPTPAFSLVRREAEAAAFFRKLGRPAVIKPVCGSGSELVFLCRDEDSCRRAVAVIKNRLGSRRNCRMYDRFRRDEEILDPRENFLIEALLEGVEYSCDFVLDGERIEIIRFSRKIPAKADFFGTVLAYYLPAEFPESAEPDMLPDILRRSARALGLKRAICMTDFIVSGNQIFLLEMTPRPGGDCLPALELASAGFDILGFTLDFAEANSGTVPKRNAWRPRAGIHLLAPAPGTVKRISAAAISSDPRVEQCVLTAGPGHRVRFPPADYDSRRLGYAVFVPSALEFLEEESRELASRLEIELETES